ncbi:hypothetical protein Anapl_09351 [Anas platyrhynchos]|uniref:Uncharacterized protein n=1 Tax=Anas platyrhynchos TaxID=8839 RepID=R0L9D6_ANAPL|nr:hypothetical protein Anapl_09351 [Anas platyrhynchos]
MLTAESSLHITNLKVSKYEVCKVKGAEKSSISFHGQGLDDLIHLPNKSFLLLSPGFPGKGSEDPTEMQRSGGQLCECKAAADLKAFSMGTGDPPFTDRAATPALPWQPINGDKERAHQWSPAKVCQPRKHLLKNDFGVKRYRRRESNHREETEVTNRFGRSSDNRDTRKSQAKELRVAKYLGSHSHLDYPNKLVLIQAQMYTKGRMSPSTRDVSK